MLGERLFNATMILLVVYAFGAVIFFFARETTLAFIKKDESDPVPEYWLILILAVPAVVAYAFVFHPVAGFALVSVLVLSMELWGASWKTEASVRLPKTVVLSYPLQERDGSLQTRVRIDGEEWSAEFVDDGLTLPVQGDVVRIVERRGLKLILARSEQR